MIAVQQRALRSPARPAAFHQLGVAMAVGVDADLHRRANPNLSTVDDYDNAVMFGGRQPAMVEIKSPAGPDASGVPQLKTGVRAPQGPVGEMLWCAVEVGQKTGESGRDDHFCLYFTGLSIGRCPRHCLHWFEEHGWHSALAQRHVLGGKRSARRSIN